MKKFKFITDGFKNIIKGLGTSKDPRESTTFQRGMVINQQIANDLYTYNWLAAKVVDIPVDDATRKWRSLLIPDPDKKKLTEEAMKKFGVRPKINLALKWSRVFGGSVILIIVDDGVTPQDEPLDLENIKKDSLKNLVVLDRWNIYPGTINYDITSDNYGKPEHYTVARNGQKVHYTRIIKFEGTVSTIRELEQENFWGKSIFATGWDPISDSQVVSNSIADLIFESNVDVYRINGLNALIAEGKDALVVKRLKIASEMKSIINGIALDKEDEYNKKSNSFANLADIDDRFIQKVAGAYNIPVTKLVGISPSGMNATGESDLLNYDDMVQSIQENDIRPQLDILDQVIIASEFGTSEPIEYIFQPLKQLTEVEQADVDSKNAIRDQVYIDLDIIKESDVLANLAENGTYVSIDEARVEAEKEGLELEEGAGIAKEEEN
jgi:phage-related protein (TIGR01555 family)